MEKPYKQDVNHCKRVKLKNFKSFKLKDNFQILIKPTSTPKKTNTPSLNSDLSAQNQDNTSTVDNINLVNLSNGIDQVNDQSISNNNSLSEEMPHETTPVNPQLTSEELFRTPKKRKICNNFDINDLPKHNSHNAVEKYTRVCSHEEKQTSEQISVEYTKQSANLFRNDDLMEIDGKTPTQENDSTNIYEKIPEKSESSQLYDVVTSPTNDKQNTDIISIKLNHPKPMLPTKKWCSEWLDSQPKPNNSQTDTNSVFNNKPHNSSPSNISLQFNGYTHDLTTETLNENKTHDLENKMNYQQSYSEGPNSVHRDCELNRDKSTHYNQLSSENISKQDEVTDNLKISERDEITCTAQEIETNEFKEDELTCNIQGKEDFQTEIDNGSVDKKENHDIDQTDSVKVNENVEKLQENQANITENESNLDENNADESAENNLDESAENNEVRRSNRIKTILEKTKPRNFMNSISSKSQDHDNNNKISEGNPFSEQVATIQTSPRLQNAVEISTELPDFELIDENIYLLKNKKSKVCKEIRHMKCECYNTAEEGESPCGTDCLNRLLMIECSSRCPFKQHCTNKRFQRKEFAPTEVFRTSWKGFGLRATSDLFPGMFVMEYCGEVLNQFEFYRRSQVYAEGNQQHFYFMALSQDEVVDATLKGNTSRFINHSCDPNCETQKWTVNGRLRVGFFAKRNVSTGEEITFDYQFERYGKEAQVCYCGTEKCRGYLGKPPSENDSEELKLLPPALSSVPPVELDRKEKKRSRKWQEFENNTLEHEISGVVGGLQTTKEVLMLSRNMVRSETVKQKLLCLNAITNTTITPCLREFTRFHGLSLLWSWMVDLSASMADSQSQLKVEILNTLKILPVTSKNAIEDSKVLPMVQRWFKEDTENSEVLAEEISNIKQKINSKELQLNDKDDKEASLEVNIVDCNVESTVKVVEDLNQLLSENEEKLEVCSKYVELLSYLLDSWKDLKEIYRIPKRNNLLQEKLPESNEADNDDLSSLNDSPLPKEEENTKQTSYYNNRSRKEKENEKSRHKKSPENQDVKSKPPSNETDNLKWLYTESSTKKSRQEHRRQFELNQDNKKVATTKDQNNLQPPAVSQVSQPIETMIESTPVNYISQPSYIAQTLPQQQIYPTMYDMTQDASVVYPQVQDQMYQEIVYPSAAIPQQNLQATYDSVNGVMYAQPIMQEQTIPVIGSQQPIQQNGVTILGSQSGQAIVLLSQEQLQQLTHQQPIAQQQQLVYPPIQTNLAQFQQLQADQSEAQQPSTTEQPELAEPETKQCSSKAEQPKDPRSLRLPPHWNTATDAEGSVYYYHTITRKTQWDPPSWNKFENLDNSSNSSSLPEHSKKGGKKSGESLPHESKESRKYREAFRKKMSQQIVSCLSAYRRPDCKVGRITSTEDFKHLARKITHEILMKEIKQVQVWEDLEVNSNTKHKAKDYVHKYMSKMGTVYKVKDHKS